MTLKDLRILMKTFLNKKVEIKVENNEIIIRTGMQLNEEEELVTIINKNENKL